jgi:hypothetical protein
MRESNTVYTTFTLSSHRFDNLKDRIENKKNHSSTIGENVS